VTVVETTVRWRAGRSPGEFGELPPWESRKVREELGTPDEIDTSEGEGPVWDLVSELARTAVGPLFARVVNNRRSLFLWIDGGDVSTFFTSAEVSTNAVPYIACRPPGDDATTTRSVLYAMAQVGTAAIASPRGGGQTRGTIAHITGLYDAMQGWCVGTVDDATLDAKARRAKNRVTHAPQATWMATHFADVCMQRAARPIGADALVAWRATLVAALETAATFSSESLVRSVFCDHMAELIARKSVELAAAGYRDAGAPVRSGR